ncbi:MAG: hypothetical protein RLZZ324_757 [Candidatus Parcubacteria bacterium]|jgi:spermidine synthase
MGSFSDGDEKQAPLIIDETYDAGPGRNIRFGLEVSQLLVNVPSAFQGEGGIKVFDSEGYGRVMTLGDCYMTASGKPSIERLYHEMLVHPTLTSCPRIGRVLVIGGGDGGTVREALRYSDVESVTLCEIDPAVVRVAQEYLTDMGVPWNDPRLTVIHEDGIAFMKRDITPTYDVIIVDGADPVGPAAALFSDAFYKDCIRHLSRFGMLATQTLSPIVQREHFLAAVKTLQANFTSAYPYFGPMPIYPGGTWSYAVAARFHLESPHALRPRMERLREVERSCTYYNPDIHAAAFALPTDIRKALNG